MNTNNENGENKNLEVFNSFANPFENKEDDKNNENLNNEENITKIENKENNKAEYDSINNQKIDNKLNNSNNVINNNKNNEVNEPIKNNDNINDIKEDKIILEKDKDKDKINNFNNENDISKNINEQVNNEIRNDNKNREKNKDLVSENKVETNKKLYTIKETGSHLYIENNKKIKSMAIEKSFDKIYQVQDFNEILNLNPIKSYHVDSILGIIDINGNNKYLLVVISSQLFANILGGDIYNILDVDLVKITLFNENENEKNRINGVKKLFNSKNFYYSNEIDLTSNNIFDKSKKNIITDYCVNTSLLKYFFNNLISKDFYSKIIYGYIGFKNNIEINNKILLDSLIIEKVNKHLNFNTDIPNQMKEIEFICIYKTKINNANNSNKKYNIKIYSFVIYVSNEISNNKIAFNPCNNFIINELNLFPNIVCIINNNININLENNININNNQIGNIIFNNNSLGKKVKLLNFTSDWKKNLFFDSINNSNTYIKNCAINSNIIQQFIFWFIDINNMFYENDCCFNAIIRIMWKAIQNQMELMNIGIDIGQFNKTNDGLICRKFKELIMNYHKDLDNNKKTLYKSKVRKQLQKVYDYYFNPVNNKNKQDVNVYEHMNKKYDNKNNLNNLNDNNFNKNNFNAYQNFAQKNNQNKNVEMKYNNHPNMNNSNNNFDYNNKNNFQNTNNININNSTTEKLSILCLTWNVSGIPSEKRYDIRDLFTQNIFYKNYQSPDIIVIGMEEIVELDFYNILTITTNEDSVSNWTDNITSTLNNIYPYTYKKCIVLHLIGVYLICFIKSQLQERIDIINKNVIKTGLFGTLGNKGYITLTLRYKKNYIISFAVGHFEAGQDSNEERIDTLMKILDANINNYNENKFRNSDFWIILGDLNFRIDSSFEEVYRMIQFKEYKDLIKFDQFYQYCKRNRDMQIFNEGIINFPPTYKYIPGSNNYVNDSDNRRIPSYTDRILFCNKGGIRNISYKSIPTLMYSDHRPVHACFEIDIKEKNNFSNNNMFNYNKNNNFQNPTNKNIMNINNNNENQSNFDDYYNNMNNENNFYNRYENNPYSTRNYSNLNLNNQNFNNINYNKNYNNQINNNMNNDLDFQNNFNQNNYNYDYKNNNNRNNNSPYQNINDNNNNIKRGNNFPNGNIPRSARMNNNNQNNYYQNLGYSNKNENNEIGANIEKSGRRFEQENKRNEENNENNQNNDDTDNIENIMKFFKK